MIKLSLDSKNDDQDYSDVDKYARMCKFTNCTHHKEPGCAIIAAINIGELTEDKLKRYLKLLRANEFLNNKTSYIHEKKNFTVGLSKFSKKNISMKKTEVALFEQETLQLQEELEEETLNVIIRKEREDELRIVENVIREAFWNVYKPGCDEHLMVHQLHASSSFIKDLDYVAEIDGQIVGNILCSKALVRNENTEHEIICIGPIGVIPEYRSKGIGSLLMKKAIESAREMGYAGIALYGNPKYYHRFGFVNAKTYGITTPDGSNFEDFMVLELGKGLLNGITGKCYEDKAFEIHPEDLIEFEKEFGKKEME